MLQKAFCSHDCGDIGLEWLWVGVWEPILLHHKVKKTRVPSIEIVRDIGIRIWKMVSWSFIVCPTLRPDRGTYDREVEGWVLLGIEVRINCLIV
jgi:hypothetical protein